MTSEEKEFIDALEDRNYVIVTTYYDSKGTFVQSDRLTLAEITNIARAKRNEIFSNMWAQSIYVAHHERLKIPVPCKGM